MDMLAPKPAQGTLAAPEALVRDLLEWVAARPRTYRETMEAWRTSCPRLPVWEDAFDGGLIQVVQRAAGWEGQTVELTDAGRARLRGR
jgi:hypothetical protein